MNWLTLIRGVLQLEVGAYFLYWGLNGFFKFKDLPQPAPKMVQFLNHLNQLPLFMTLVKATEVLGGALLILNIFVPIALLLLAPIVVGIVGSQIFFNRQQGVAISIWTFVPYSILLAIYLVWAN